MNLKIYKILSIILVLIILFLLSIYFIYIPKKHGKIVSKYCDIYGVDEKLVYAVIKTESNFNKKALSKSGAVGLMQIMPQTARFVLSFFDDKLDESDCDLTNPETNIMIGIKYLFYLKNRFFTLDETLAAYNAGEGRVKSWLNNSQFSNDGKTLQAIPFGETKKYVERVKKFYKYYKFFYF